MLPEAGDEEILPEEAGALNIPAALLASMHAPAPGHFVPLPVGGTAPSADQSTLLWDGSRWASTYFDGSRWANTYLDGSRWASAGFDGSRWANAGLDGSRWASAYWDGSRWAGAYWDGSRWSGSDWDSAASFD